MSHHYFMAAMKKHDAEAFAQYQQGAVRTLSQHRMRPLAVTEAKSVEDGDLDADVLVLIEFEDEAEFRAWWDSAEYAAVKPIREKSTTTTFAVLFPGEVRIGAG